MSDPYWLTDEQLARTEPLFPKPRGRFRVDEKKVTGGTVFIIRNG